MPPLRFRFAPIALAERVCSARALGLGLALMCGACTSEVEPIQVGEGCPSQPLRGPLEEVATEPADALIDDFERGDNQLPHLGARDGAWVVGSDATSVVLTAESSSQCSARGREAGHFAGRDFTDWGANWTAVFRIFVNAMARPYDASAYGGISFWAALGGDSGASLTTPVGVTTMDTAWNSGMCNRCMDFHRTEIVLSTRWERHEIRFDQLAQAGVGDPLVPLRRDQLVGLILWPPKSGFDIWIDDVRFEP
ncbi:MAG: hypothetical protein ACOY0T_16015 [Myxococcota bacterium]